MTRRYGAYKDSGVEWIGEIPEHWEITKIKFVKNDGFSSFIDGDWIESSNISESGIRYITTGNIGVGYYKEQGAGFISEETFYNLNCTEVFEGDLIISRLSPPVGRSCIIPDLGFRIVTSVDNVILRPKEGIDKKYLNFFFNHRGYQDYNELLSRGTTLTRISRNMLGNNIVLLPPEIEQSQIVEFLDAKTSLIDKLIDVKQRRIELLKEKRAALINHAVTKGLDPNVKMQDSGIEWIGEIPEHWEVSRFKYETQIPVRYGLNISSDVYEQHGVRFIRITDITEAGEISDLGAVYLKEQDIPKDFLLESGDMLFSRSGHTVGKSYLHLKTGKFASAGYLVRFNFGDFVKTRFIHFVTKSQYYWDWIRLNTVTSTIENVNGDKYQNFIFVKPSEREQKEIVNYLEIETKKIDDLVALKQKKIDLLKEYRQALISETVTGKKRINGVSSNDE